MDPGTIMLILKLVDLAAAGLQLWGEDKERYDRLSAKVRQLVEEGRPPTEDEFAELDAESRTLTDRILAATAAGRA